MIKKALVLSTLSLSFVSFAAFAQNVAVVNGKAIPSSYSDEAVKEVVKQGGKDTPELRNNIKTQLIVGEVLLQEAEKQNLASTDAVKKQMEMARRSILIDTLRNNYVTKNPVSDNEVKAEYDRLVKMQKGQTEYHVKHILVKDKATADSIIKQVSKNPASFEKLAQEKSLDKASAARGGDHGLGHCWRSRQAIFRCNGIAEKRPGQQDPCSNRIRLSHHQGSRFTESENPDL